MKVSPLMPDFGAEVEGADLRQMTAAQFSELFDIFTDKSVIFLRDQHALSEAEHLEFAGRFGEIYVHPAARGKPADYPGLIRVRTTAESRVSPGNRWHSDISCDEYPPQASILQLHRMPAVGGDTLFTSLYAAYDTLSERMKVMLDGLTALHSGEETFRHLFRLSADEDFRWPENNHPVVRRHVDSGKPALFVNREYTLRINELPKAEGRSLLEFLFSHSERVDFQCRFRWSTNAIAIWDNRCALHHALWDYWPAEREGRRVSATGEKPVPWLLDQDEVGPVDAPVRLTV